MKGPEVMLDLCAALFPPAGIGRYVQDVAHALRSMPDAPQARFAYPSSLRREALARYRPDELHEVRMGWPLMRVVCVTSAWLGLGCDGLYDRPAIFHSPMGYGPLFGDALVIANVHDLTFFEHPEWHPLRTSFILRQARVVRAIDGGENRIVAPRNAPALANILHGNAHRVGRLMARNARPAVAADGFEKGMAFGIHGPVKVKKTKPPPGVFERSVTRQLRAPARFHPERVRPYGFVALRL